MIDDDAGGAAPNARSGRWRALDATFLLALVAGGVASLALLDLGIRAAIRWDPAWDGLGYHVPFAAMWGGLSIPFQMTVGMAHRFEGFPPLPEFVEGVLWRVTGSVNATGVANFLAFGAFLAYCHKLLRAPFWLVALISLTAPLVVIHTTTVYVDLFGNAFLAIGLASCLALFLFPERRSRAVIVGALAALSAAAWSKYQLVPLVGLTFLVMSVMLVRSRVVDRFSRRQAAAILLCFMALAAAPYAKNLVLFGNPFWPVRVPVVGSMFAYREAGTDGGLGRPVDLQDAPQAQVFAMSLFETRNPASRGSQPRWTLDQANGDLDRRMGGFWWAGVIIYLLLAGGLLVTYRRRAGIIAVVGGLGVLTVVALLPQSNELRYYQFLPLTWAATIAMLYPSLRARLPRVAAGVLVLVLVLFGYMAWENRSYYRPETVGYQEMATSLGMAAWWPRLQAGQTYCAVGIFPRAILLTGPTMHEFTIIDRDNVTECPIGAVVLTPDGIQGPYQPG